jgi:transposase InsO family protein
MPWKVTHPVNEKMEFVVRWQKGERITDLCREFGISRKTGHKLTGRFARLGPAAFDAVSSRPNHSPNRTPQDIVARLLELRARHSTWGPKKVRECFLQENPGVRVPATSTVGSILETAGLVRRRQRRRRCESTPSTTLRQTAHPNELWSIDFKGQFRLGNRAYCYPLTLTDHCSRFLLLCEALDNTRRGGVQACLEEVFETYGLPDALRNDNGSPFASSGRFGLTRLSVWLLRLGIELERIEKGHPEQNGRHERMHLTLKQDTTRPARYSMLQQQETFDAFREIYNNQRPHEALAMRTPGSAYAKSVKKYRRGALDPLFYPLHDATMRVGLSGHIRVGHKMCYIGEAFATENIGVRQLADNTHLVSFMDFDIGYVEGSTGLFMALQQLEPTTTVSPRSPV